MNSIRKFLVSEDGPTAVEYAVMLAFILMIALAGIGAVGSRASSSFNNSASQIGNAMGS